MRTHVSRYRARKARFSGAQRLRCWPFWYLASVQLLLWLCSRFEPALSLKPAQQAEFSFQIALLNVQFMNRTAAHFLAREQKERRHL